MRHLLKSVRHQPSMQPLLVTDILRAGNLIKKEPRTIVEFEKFDMPSMQWVTEKIRKFHIEKDQFSSEAFRNAFKTTGIADGREWAIKKYIPKAVKNMEDLGMTLEDHARKQVQLHSAARSIAQICAKTAPPEFGETFQNGKVYFGFLNVPVTVEEFIDGQFAKYINSDGKCKALPLNNMKCVYQKAHTVVHFSYELFKKKFIILDIQGSMYNL